MKVQEELNQFLVEERMKQVEGGTFSKDQIFSDDSFNSMKQLYQENIMIFLHNEYDLMIGCNENGDTYEMNFDLLSEITDGMFMACVTMCLVNCFMKGYTPMGVFVFTGEENTNVIIPVSEQSWFLLCSFNHATEEYSSTTITEAQLQFLGLRSV